MILCGLKINSSPAWGWRCIGTYHAGPLRQTLGQLAKHSKQTQSVNGLTRFLDKKRPEYRIFLREYRAVTSLLDRSNITRSGCVSNDLLLNLQRRHFRTSSSLHNDKPTNKDKSEKSPDKEGQENDDDEPKSSMLAKALVWMLSSYLFMTLLSLLFPDKNKGAPEQLRYVSWTEFCYQMLAKGEVEQITINADLNLVVVQLYEGAVVRGRRVDNNIYHINIANLRSFEDKLRQAERHLGIRPDKSVPVVYERVTESNWLLLISLVTVALMILLLFRSGQIKVQSPTDMFSQMGKARFTIIDPHMPDAARQAVRFSDVAGLHEAKVEIMEFVDYLRAPERFKKLGAKVPKGVLLLGPPGCGKTMLAKAVATEGSVPFLAMAGSEFVEMIGGLGAARVRDLFKEARKRAPCIVYLDEIDAIGRQRSGVSGGDMGGSGGEAEQTLNQLLVEMDGMANREGVIMLASTNRADVLDKALLRAGRFDRHILIDWPTLKEREEIFDRHMSDIKVAPNLNKKEVITELAARTPGFSGADIANICNESALHAARKEKQAVEPVDLEYAVERVVGGTEKRTKTISPSEKRMIAFHEAGHALVGWMLKHTDALLKVSIVPRTSNALGWSQYTSPSGSDRFLHSKEELFEKMCMALGGRVAESLVFNHVSTGGEDDLKKVTKWAYAQIRHLGMDDVIGNIAFPTEQETGNDDRFMRKPYSKRLSAMMDDRARLLVAQVYKETERVLQDNRDKLNLIAETLLSKETINYKEMEQLIGPPPHGHKRTIEALDIAAAVASEPSSPTEGNDTSGDGDSNGNGGGGEGDKPATSQANSQLGSRDQTQTATVLDKFSSYIYRLRLM